MIIFPFSFLVFTPNSSDRLEVPCVKNSILVLLLESTCVNIGNICRFLRGVLVVSLYFYSAIISRLTDTWIRNRSTSLG